MAGKDLIDQGIKRRKAILAFLAKYQKKNGMPPTISEIAEAVGLGSPNATRNHLHKLELEGKIKMRKRVARGITLVEQAAPKLERKAS